MNKIASDIISPIYSRASSIIEQARSTAYRQINETLIRRNWELGKLIAEEELQGEDRAQYGAAIIQELSKRLTAEYGKGFTKTNLYSFSQFFQKFPNIFHTVCGKSIPLLSWSHYRTLLQELNDDARLWYEREAAQEAWSVRTLQRNNTQRHLNEDFTISNSQSKCIYGPEGVAELEFIKCPYVPGAIYCAPTCRYSTV